MLESPTIIARFGRGGCQYQWIANEIGLENADNLQFIEAVNSFLESHLAKSEAWGIQSLAKPTSKPEAKLDFPTKVKQVAERIGADPIDLLTLMSFETAGTLSPKVRGPHVPGQGKAVGLIQFMPATAQELGTSTEELAAMSPVAQLDYVERYLIKRGFRGGGLKQLYSTVFAGHPNARGSISDGYHSLDSAVERMNRSHRPKAIAILGGSQLEKTKAIISTWSDEFQREPSLGDTIAGYSVTSPRGWRTIKGKTQFHQGVDLGTPVNTPLYALADGWVECKQSDAAGKVASFSSDLFPALEFKLLHLNKCVAKPESKLQVKQGEVIGWTGNTGSSTGAHLDLRIKYQVTGKWLRVRAGWLYWFVTGEKPLSSPN